jgi:hypothetical protein
MATQRKFAFTLEPYIYMLTLNATSASVKMIHHTNFNKWIHIFPDINEIYLDLPDMKITVKIVLELIEDYGKGTTGVSMIKKPNEEASAHETLSIQFRAMFLSRNNIISNKIIELNLAPKKDR